MLNRSTLPWLLVALFALGNAQAILPPVADPLPLADGFNADFLDGQSSEVFFDAIDDEAATRAAADSSLAADIAAETAARDAAIEANRPRVYFANAASPVGNDAVFRAALTVEFDTAVPALVDVSGAINYVSTSGSMRAATKIVVDGAEAGGFSEVSDTSGNSFARLSTNSLSVVSVEPGHHVVVLMGRNEVGAANIAAGALTVRVFPS